MPEEIDIIVHDSQGLQLRKGPPGYDEEKAFPPFEGKVKCFISSPNGKRLAWIANGEVIVVESPHWKRIGTLKHPKAQEIVFSPQGNYLAIWDIYAKVEGAAAVPNLSIYDVSARKLLKAFFQQNQAGWQPQWTKDESLLARSTTNEVHFYNANDLQNIEKKKVLKGVRSFSLSPSSGTYHTIFYVPSAKGAPACVNLYKYPNFSDNAPPLAQKSFFKVESIEVFWNAPCSAALILTTSEVDKSGTSYYGEQNLYYLDTSGESIRVTFQKPGNIRSVAWTPSGKEFFAVYGTAPARATLFNRKCDPVTEFGDGARNLVLLNPPGNIVMLGGLGNISSRFEMWDVKERKLLGQQDHPDITHMEWSPCGKYFLTSTCCPRLRVNNGYRIWHYTGTLQHEILYTNPNELYAATWLPNPSAEKPFEISSAPVKGIHSQVKKASKERYVPPSQRAAAALVDNVTKFLSQREEPIDPEVLAKQRELQKKKENRAKKKEEKQKAKEQEKGMDKDWRDEETRKLLEKQRQEKEAKIKASGGNKSKRIKNIKKKLESIEALKKEQDAGKSLNASDLKKLASEEPLRQEMQELQAALHAENNGEPNAQSSLAKDVENSLTLT